VYKNLDRSFFRFVTINACDRRTDRRTDGRTEFSSQYRVCITLRLLLRPTPTALHAAR